MKLNNGNIYVGQHLTKMSPNELLKQKLSLAIANDRNSWSRKGDNTIMSYNYRNMLKNRNCNECLSRHTCFLRKITLY